MAESDVGPGTLLGKYRLVRLMGEGGMALVYEAEHVALGQRAAIKILREELADDPLIVQRFEREGRAIGKLRSRHIVRILDVDTTPSGAPYLVMEMLEGWDLDEEIIRRGAMPIDESIGFMLQAARGLAEAHALGIVHRDVKPSNLFLANEEGMRVVKVLDFGIAGEATTGNARLTRAESVMGTPTYMAPEQYRGSHGIDARADVWALGATLYELLAGKPPFVGTPTTIGVAVVNDPVPPIQELRPDLPDALAALVMRALEKDREARFPTAREFADAFEHSADRVVISTHIRVDANPESRRMAGARTQMAMTAHTEPAPPMPGARSGRRYGLVAAAAIVGVAAVAAALYVATRSPPAVPIAASSSSIAPSASVAATVAPTTAPLPEAIAPAASVATAPSAIASTATRAAMPIAKPAAVRAHSSAPSAPDPPPAPSKPAAGNPLFFPTH